MKRAEPRIGGIIAALATLLSAAPASAYCRTTTARDVTSLGECPSEGLPLYWPSQCVGYRISEGRSGRIPVAQLSPVVARAFARWTNPGEVCLPSIDVVALAPTSNRDIGYEPDRPNVHLIVFRDEPWRYDPMQLEHTTLTFKVDTGEILDADMEINAVDVTFGVGGDVSPGEFDLETVLTHGAGHFLGLAHSTEPDSVMVSRIEPGVARQLTTDDAEGICAIYPETGERVTRDQEGNEVRLAARTCSLAESGGECGPLDVAHGCSIVTSGKGAKCSLVPLCALLGAGLVSCRRRRRPQPQPAAGRPRRCRPAASGSGATVPGCPADRPHP